MKRILCLASAILLAAGCQHAQPPSSSALQPTPEVTQVEPAPAQTAEPTAAIDTQTPTPMTDLSTGPAGASGGSYTVKAGDTLYRIALNHYGDGKQWKRIVAANPGVAPEHLRIGQTLILP